MTQKLFPRWTNVILGGWLLLSAFLWQHTVAQFNNSWLVGLAAAVAAAAAMRTDKMRYVNVVLAVWLFISAFALPVLAAATFWNNLVVSVLMLIAALAPQATREPARRAPSRHSVEAHR